MDAHLACLNCGTSQWCVRGRNAPIAVIIWSVHSQRVGNAGSVHALVHQNVALARAQTLSSTAHAVAPPDSKKAVCKMHAGHATPFRLAGQACMHHAPEFRPPNVGPDREVPLGTVCPWGPVPAGTRATHCLSHKTLHSRELR